MRLSRPCYDKPHRCPGWAGGGPKHAKVDRCHSGNLHGYWPGWKWRFHRHVPCGTLVIPWVLRWLSPFYVCQTLKYHFDNWREDREWK